MTDREQAPIRRRSKDEVAEITASELRKETQQELVEWTLRAGLGPLFMKQVNRDRPPEEIGKLIAVTFDAWEDPMHDDIVRTLIDWRSHDE